MQLGENYVSQTLKQKIEETLSKILSDRHDAKITIKFVKQDNVK